MHKEIHNAWRQRSTRQTERKREREIEIAWKKHSGCKKRWTAIITKLLQAQKRCVLSEKEEKVAINAKIQCKTPCKLCSSLKPV